MNDPFDNSHDDKAAQKLAQTAEKIALCPAFPTPDEGVYGMTYREWLAGIMAQGLLACDISHRYVTGEDVASDAVNMTDALIWELARNPFTK